MKTLIFSAAVLLLLQLSISAQDSSPYWSLAGNNKANSSSKLGTTNAVNLRFYTNNFERMRINTSGMVGIGTNAPVTKLTVNGFGSFGNRVTALNATRALNLIDDNAVMRVLRVDSVNAPAIELISRKSADGFNAAYWDVYAQPGDASFRIRDRLGRVLRDRLTISHLNGYVGFGTSAPEYSLDVRSGSAFGQFKGVTGDAGVIIDKLSFGKNANVFYKTGSANVWSAGTNGDNDFSIRNWDINRNAITISADNNCVGIGTLDPTARLQVRGIDGLGDAIHANGYIIGVAGTSESQGIGVYGKSDGGVGVYGYTDTGYAVYGRGYEKGYGVYGLSANYFGGNFESENGWGLRAMSTNGYYAAAFYGRVYASDGYITSDKNLKKNIHEFGNAMSIINKLKPQNYEFKNDARYASLHLPKGNHYGLLTQDLEQVLPNLVSETPHELREVKSILTEKPRADSKYLPIMPDQKATKEAINIKAVNYLELIPILVKAMQELDTEKNKKIDDLQNQINDLKDLIIKRDNTSTATSLGGYMKQNIPNPSKK